MGRVRVEEEGEEGVGARGRVEDARDALSRSEKRGERAGGIVVGLLAVRCVARRVFTCGI